MVQEGALGAADHIRAATQRETGLRKVRSRHSLPFNLFEISLSSPAQEAMGPFVQRLRPEIHSSLSILLLFSRLTQQPALSSPLEHILSPHCPPSQPSLAHTAQHLINPGSDLFCHLLPVSLQLPLLFHSHSPHPAPALTSPPLPWITATASRLFYESLLSPPHPPTCPAGTCHPPNTPLS